MSTGKRGNALEKTVFKNAHYTFTENKQLLSDSSVITQQRDIDMHFSEPKLLKTNHGTKGVNIYTLLLLFWLLSHFRLFCDPTDCSLPGSSVHGILQARSLEWVAMPFSRAWPRDRTWTSCMVRQILYHWTSWEATMYT